MNLATLPTWLLVLLSIIPVTSAIILHEIAHGWVAKQLGDNTAARMGRLSLNPLRHIDPVGTIIVPLVMLVLTNFVFGWAKPVPIDWRQLHHPRRDMVLVALAGPGSNLLMLAGWTLLAKVFVSLPFIPAVVSGLVVAMCTIAILINTILMVFNLLPLPPLDGGRVAVGLLPPALGRPLARIEPFGLLVIVALLASGLLGQWLSPVVSQVLQLAQDLIF